jgi:uncharacterized protein
MQARFAGLAVFINFLHIFFTNLNSIIMKKKVTLAVFLFIALHTLSIQKASAQQAPEHKIVMQLASNDTMVWKGLMNNLRNLKEGWGDSLQLEVVAHGPGIELLMHEKTTQLEKIRSMKAKGIVFYACENTMKEKKIPHESIIPEASFVRMGIGHIVIRQEQGWSYIKTGF